MKEIDNIILNLLQEDARYTAEKIAVMIGSDVDTVQSSIKEMEKTGVILKYTTVINPEAKTDNCVDALIEVRVTPQKDRGFDAIAEEIYRFDEVKTVYLMSGGYDITIIIEGRTMRDISNFVHEKLAVMDNVVSTSTHFILKYYKTGGVILDSPKKEKRIPIEA